MSRVGDEVRVEAPRPSRACYDATIVALNTARVVIKHPTTGALEHVERATGRLLQFDRRKGWQPTGWTLHPADVEALKKPDETAPEQAVDRGDDLPRLQDEGADRGG